MLEPHLLPSEHPPAHEETGEIDPRGWLMATVAMVLIGLWSMRPAPAPVVPERVDCALSEPWMVDALPGIGPRTRDRYWQIVRAGSLAGLPERSRTMARQAFRWPGEAQPSNTEHPSVR
jgi:hypothetical protein